MQSYFRKRSIDCYLSQSYPREPGEYHGNILPRKALYQTRIKLLRQKYYLYLTCFWIHSERVMKLKF
jgi:hypothetical protein